MSTVVTDHLVQLIAKQVDDKGIVVWYDPQKAYQNVAASLQLSKTTVALYEGSFFKLRHEIDSLMNDEQPPRLLIYIPLAQGEAHDALIELEKAGVVMQPGQQPPNRNTRLSIVARNALKSVLGDDTAAEVERQAEAGKLSLSDLNALAEKGQGISKGVISLVFQTGDTEEMALAFLSSDRCDEEVEKKSATKELAGLFETTYEVKLSATASLKEVRERLARHILLTDLLAVIGKDVPRSLASIKTPTMAFAIEGCRDLARHWRLRHDLRESYVTASKQVESEFSLAKVKLDPDVLSEADTFLAIERALLQHVEKSLYESATPELLNLARSRMTRFWSDVVPSVQAHWALIAAAAEVLLEAERVSKELKKAPTTVPALINAYAEGDSPWCQLDTYHRHMESRWHNFETDSHEPHETLEKLRLKAVQRYTTVASELAKHFVTQFSKAKHPIPKLRRQVETYDKLVKPVIAEGKTAYVWVDALRFEMARELCEVLRPDFEIALEPAIGMIPTITEVGMAALLPGAASARVEEVGDGKLGLRIGETLIEDRKDRVAFLKATAGTSLFEAKLDDLLPKPSKKVRDGIEAAQLVLVTSQEIDELCEQDNIVQARRQMDGVLSDLRRGVKVLGDLGVKKLVLVADHGHLFADEISDDMKIDSPGGKTADLHRRVWVGVGGATDSAYFRGSLQSLGVESDLDLATPWTLAVFKAKGGARAYFHGGLSPQELVVPVMVLTPLAQPTQSISAAVGWELVPGSPKLTTRFFSVQVRGISSGLFETGVVKVRLELLAKGKCISQPISASYGFEDATGEVVMKPSAQNQKQYEPNTVTLMVAEEVTQKTVSVALIDAATGAELVGLDKIEVAISM